MSCLHWALVDARYFLILLKDHHRAAILVIIPNPINIVDLNVWHVFRCLIVYIAWILRCRSRFQFERIQVTRLRSDLLIEHLIIQVWLGCDTNWLLLTFFKKGRKLSVMVGILTFYDSLRGPWVLAGMLIHFWWVQKGLIIFNRMKIVVWNILFFIRNFFWYSGWPLLPPSRVLGSWPRTFRIFIKFEVNKLWHINLEWPMAPIRQSKFTILMMYSKVILARLPLLCQTQCLLKWLFTWFFLMGHFILLTLFLVFLGLDV